MALTSTRLGSLVERHRDEFVALPARRKGRRSPYRDDDIRGELVGL